MLKRVDVEVVQEEITGYSYANKDGSSESVNCGFAQSSAKIRLANGDQTGYDEVSVYLRDIPKLVLALQAMYDLKKGTL